MARGDRLDDQPGLDGLVICAGSALVEVGRRSHPPGGSSAAGVDVPLAWENLTDTVVTRKQHTLVSHGPYRWVRHPLYSSAALIVVALSLVAANWFFFVAGMALLCLLVVRTRTEEANLVARFGDSYRQYMKRTGRFVPKLG